MATTQPQQETTLQVRRVFAAPRERVFRAWTDREQFSKWFGPSPDHATVVTEFDVRPGGKYNVEITHKGGNVHKHGGVYREVKPPEKLVFTWNWQNGADTSDTLVTLEFQDLGTSTVLVLTHERFPNAEIREQHNQGWTGCLDQLAKFLS
jgi:uncharacterized protein YndB with AHSA1/START domain